MIAMFWAGCREPSPAEGAALFGRHCARCHIAHPGQASPAPLLSGYFYRSPRPTVRDARSVIREGRRAMPPFGARLSAPEVDDLVAYLETLR